MPFTKIEGQQPTVPVRVYSADRMEFEWGDLCARRSALRAAQQKDKRKRLQVVFESGVVEKVAVGRIREVAGRSATTTRQQRKRRRAERIERTCFSCRPSSVRRLSWNYLRLHWRAVPSLLPSNDSEEMQPV